MNACEILHVIGANDLMSIFLVMGNAVLFQFNAICNSLRMSCEMFGGHVWVEV